ncbi:HAMP domain-containing histidine kinase [Salinispirillum sp. LH 10-3-1]|uniref:histidine kinase n=1 Tax=Salinispirillum sp. LH 10-3-1 TaxID=2952525 RepID=A0AB38YF00_9GAMM
MSSRPSEKLWRSSSFRITVLYLGLSWLTLAIVMLFMYQHVRSQLWQGIHAQLDQDVVRIERFHQRQPLDPDRPLPVYNSEQGSERLWILEVKRRNGDHKIYTGAKPRTFSIARPPGFGRDSEAMLMEEGGHLFITRRISLPPNLTARIGRNVDYLYALDAALRGAIISGLLLTLLLSLAGAILLGRRTVRRLNDINRLCADIVAGHMDKRVPVETGRDDYDRLALSINLMLDRIQQLMHSIQQVSDNIAHDLKTPLARLRARLELIRQDQDGEVMDEVMAEADRMMVMFNALLRIGRLEAGSAQLKRDHIDMLALVNDLAELYEPLFEDKGIRFQVVGQGLPTQGDPDLWFQALGNLLDNALKYTPEGGEVSIRLQSSSGQTIEVIDRGPGIAPEQREQVFERFFRAEAHRQTEGFGLGLSLVRAVAHIHRAELSLHDAKPGLRVRIQLPSVG